MHAFFFDAGANGQQATATTRPDVVEVLDPHVLLLLLLLLPLNGCAMAQMRCVMCRKNSKSCRKYSTNELFVLFFI